MFNNIKDILIKKGYKLILASKSKRRQELFKRLAIPFQTIHSDIDEIFLNKNIRRELINNTLKKAKNIKTRKKALIIAGDTVIVYNKHVFGKPKTCSEAQSFLKSFSGKTHQVLTGLVVYNSVSKKAEHAIVSTKVTFRKLSSEDINKYLDTVQYKDKAGGYGIQEAGCFLIEKIHGDYYNVVGLPLVTTVRLLKKAVKKI